ncbi:1-acyl-sn-glycerol-3-phosphate acyltransferase [Desulfonatronovibrio magnus]|uniref:1-acyl-sn-glycerol-3-phosphate acyltransferase n=1 Tax=Desulfonatronovibrio magnus TaxID=698827 RepID=UPI0012FA520C|nr:1-acyl-sn-glycerol-3-phosphate acyltransferase [Desulfonatronovibrio magnus]
MKQILKIISSIYLVIIFTIISVLTLIFYRDPKKRLDRISRNTAMFSPILLWIMGVQVRIKDHSNGRAFQGKTMVVANHLSYLDVFILAALRPTLFISSVELSRTFFMGHISKLGGTVFVERRKYTQLRQEIDKIAAVLDHGFFMGLFPEARTSDGTSVLPFKGALFEAAIRSDADVVPACFKYRRLEGKPLTAENKSIVVYHNIKFAPHIINLFKYNKIEVDLELFDRVPTVGKTRKKLVSQTYSTVLECYGKGFADR